MNDINIRISPAAYKRLKRRKRMVEKSIKQLIDELSQPKRGVAVRTLKGV